MNQKNEARYSELSVGEDVVHVAEASEVDEYVDDDDCQDLIIDDDFSAEKIGSENVKKALEDKTPSPLSKRITTSNFNDMKKVSCLIFCLNLTKTKKTNRLNFEFKY